MPSSRTRMLSLEFSKKKGLDMQFCLAKVDELQRKIENEKDKFDRVYERNTCFRVTFVNHKIHL